MVQIFLGTGLYQLLVKIHLGSNLQVRCSFSCLTQAEKTFNLSMTYLSRPSEKQDIENVSKEENPLKK